MGESCPFLGRPMTRTKVIVNKENKNSDENKLLTLAPLFGWVWDRECLISKTLHGPQICAQLEFAEKEREREEEEKLQGKFKINFNELFILVQLSV